MPERMAIGINSGGRTVARTVEDAQRAEAEGFAAYSMPGDSLAAFTVVGTQTERMRLITAVVPIFGLHPSTMARQALTAQDAAGGRFTLGIGLSHKVVIEGRLGISFDRPAARMREYLNILMPLLNGEAAQFEGEHYTLRGADGPGGGGETTPAPCVIAAMAPVMLRLAGEAAGGTILWMANAKAIDGYVAPRLRRAASNAGRAEPEIVCSLPIALTGDVTAAREQANKQFANYGTLPSYRSMLDAGLAETPGDAALLGDEAALDAELDRLERAGVTLFNGSLFRAEQGGPQRTREYLASRARERGE